MQERIDDDYSDFMLVDFDGVEEFIKPAMDYVCYIEQLIEKRIPPGDPAI
jgi:hypothetical protein